MPELFLKFPLLFLQTFFPLPRLEDKRERERRKQRGRGVPTSSVKTVARFQHPVPRGRAGGMTWRSTAGGPRSQRMCHLAGARSAGWDAGPGPLPNLDVFPYLTFLPSRERFEVVVGFAHDMQARSMQPQGIAAGRNARRNAPSPREGAGECDCCSTRLASAKAAARPSLLATRTACGVPAAWCHRDEPRARSGVEKRGGGGERAVCLRRNDRSGSKEVFGCKSW